MRMELLLIVEFKGGIYKASRNWIVLIDIIAIFHS
jgi:hypothetical protein